MFTRPFRVDRFLRSLVGTAPFMDYCRTRQISFQQTLSVSMQPGDLRRWTAALAELPHEQHAQVELELATVNELSGSDGVEHLLEAASEGTLPSDSIPSGAPVALWFFVHHPQLFHEVFVHHEIEEVGAWRTAQATPGLALLDLDRSVVNFTEALRAFFRVRDGTGRFCTVEAHRLSESVCGIAQVADRLQFLDVFTDSGKPSQQRLRRARPVLFVYYPADGTVLLKSHLRSANRVAELFQAFGEAVLGCPVAMVDTAFDLDRLKAPFRPLPDADDMEMVRVKALHLRYPARSGRRCLKLETLVSDEPTAIEQLLHSHVAGSADEQLHVCHAELQVRLRAGGRPRNYLIRLWPNRCSLSQTQLGDRFRVCLKRWGLAHGR